MKAGHLQFPFEVEFDHRGIANLQKVVVLQKIGQDPGVNEQGGLALGGLRCSERMQLRAKVLEQSGRRPMLADAEANPPGPIGLFRKWAKVQADDGFLQPAPGYRDDFVDVDGEISLLEV
jgi:hypothetical protein